MRGDLNHLYIQHEEETNHEAYATKTVSSIRKNKTGRIYHDYCGSAVSYQKPAVIKFKYMDVMVQKEVPHHYPPADSKVHHDEVEHPVQPQDVKDEHPLQKYQRIMWA